MPYRGRPSRGCQTCRQRKIRCDQRAPKCENCDKAGWVCPGYRDLNDVLFHDESARVVRKAKASRRRPGGERSVSEETEAPIPNRKDVVADHASNPEGPQPLKRAQSGLILPSIGMSISPDLDELGLGYFFYNYVAGPISKNDYSSLHHGNGCLLASIKAAGIAGVTKTNSGPSCSPQAQRQYLNAIQLTNAALQSPVYVRRDSTLMTINVLGIFESITGFHRTLKSWQDHTYGAAALLQHRGAEQFETATGARLFLQTSGNLGISCIQRRQPIPTHIHDLQSIAEKLVPDPQDRTWRFHVIRLRFADLYAKLTPGNALRSSEDAGAIVREALDLDTAIIDLLTDPPPTWQHSVTYCQGSAVFAGYCYVYRHHLIAQLCNSLFATRIVLLDIGLKALRRSHSIESIRLSQEEQQRLASSSAITRKLQLDILASVPQHTGRSFVQSDFPSSLNNQVASETVTDGLWTNFTTHDCNPWQGRGNQPSDLPFVRMSGGYLLQWPLLVAGAADVHGGDIRNWVIAVLKILGQSMGVQQAVVLANWLEADVNEQFNAHRTFSFEEGQ